MKPYQRFPDHEVFSLGYPYIHTAFFEACYWLHQHEKFKNEDYFYALEHEKNLQRGQTCLGPHQALNPIFTNTFVDPLPIHLRQLLKG